MRYEIKKTLRIETTLDSSEMIMFTKGGQHKVVIEKQVDFGEYDKIEISVQLDSSHKSRYDWLGNEVKNLHPEGVSSIPCAEHLGSTTPQLEPFADPFNPKFAYEDAKNRMNEYAKAAKKPKKK